MIIIFYFFKKLIFYPRDITVFTKKSFLELLSIPITRKPFFEKKDTDSEPTNPHDPVTMTVFI